MEKIVVITGGTSGIGLNLKQKFEQQNAIVYALSRTNPFGTQNFITCDITDESQVKNAINQIVEKHGKIDILINNAGYGLFGASELIETEQIAKQMDTNFMGAVIVTKHAIKHMQSGAKIFNISSACALFPLPYRNYYSASKSALLSYSMGLKMELKPLNIEVTCICPGDIKTPFVKNRVKNFQTDERYKNCIQNASQKVESKNDKRMDENYACKKIYKIMRKDKLKPQYIIGTKYKLLNFILKFLPQQAYINFVEKHFGGHE